MNTKTDEKKARQSRLVEILTLTFATPATLSILAKLDKRLDFAPLLERAVINFKSVSLYAWKQLEDLTGIIFTEYYEILTFSLLLLLPTLYRTVSLYLIYRGDQSHRVMHISGYGDLPAHFSYFAERRNEDTLLVVSSFCFIVYLSVIFDLFSLFFPAFVLMVSLTILSSCWGFLEKKFKLENFDDYAVPVFSVIPVLALVMIMSSDTFPEEFTFAAVSIYLVAAFANLAVITIPFLFVSLILNFGAKNVAYVGFWFVGILILNWVAVTGVPAVEAFLDAAEAS